MNVLETTLQVNKFARRIRHMKNFSRIGLIAKNSHYLVEFLTLPMRTRAWHFLSAMVARAAEALPVSPQGRLLFQAGAVSMAALVLTSFSAGSTFLAPSRSYSTDYIASYATPGDVLIANEDGYLVKINPQTHESNRIGMTDYAVHIVESGESLSGIAVKYGVSAETIMWENGLYNPHSIRTGQSLMIPPVDGVGYKVQGGDTLDKLAKKYSISVDSIIAQNGLSSEVLQKGQAIFLPGAKPLNPVIAVRNTGVTRAGSRSSVAASPSDAAPAIGKTFIFPTSGKITQGYRAGHYALDIADRSKPAIWAASGGTVEKASSGTWGGGYGNHVIIDHGDGVKTLYAHMSSLNVYEGQEVGQGDVIGIMGNTGRVYGATGIHLHWEVIINGIKQNPGSYY